MCKICESCGQKVAPKKAEPYTTFDKKFIEGNTHLTAKEIGDHLGRKTSAIYTFCQRNNIKLKRKGSANRGEHVKQD